jgi:hypothetical protein
MSDIDDKGGQAEQLALWTIRSARRPVGLPFSFWMTGQTDHWRDLQAISTMVRAVSQEVAAQRGRGLDIAPLGQVWITTEERHLLRAAVLTDSADALASNAALTQPIMTAAAMLGAALAAHGYWLPKPRTDTRTLACAALSVARQRTTNWDQADVLWP